VAAAAGQAIVLFYNRQGDHRVSHISGSKPFQYTEGMPLAAYHVSVSCTFLEDPQQTTNPAYGC